MTSVVYQKVHTTADLMSGTCNCLLL